MARLPHLLPVLAAYFRPVRVPLLLAIYVAVSAASLLLAYELRFEFALDDPVFRELRWQNLLWVLPLKLVFFFNFGQFGGLLSFFRLPDLYRLGWSCTLATLCLLAIWQVTDGRQCPPRSVIITDGALTLFFVAGFRTALRVARERFFEVAEAPKVERRVAIVGAGDAGAQVAADLLARRFLGLRPVVFFDDDTQKWGRTIHGIDVAGGLERLPAVRKAYGIEQVILALPTAPPKRVREIVAAAKAQDLEVQIVPSLAQLSTGRVSVGSVRKVEIEDLLMRETVALDSEGIRALLAGRRVLVTGAGGSIGTELCRQIAACGPAELVLLDRSEVQLFVVEQQLAEEGVPEVRRVPVVADITDEARVAAVLARHRPELVFHAAAHKHVPMMERQPGEALKNNTLGTARLLDLAARHGVRRFVVISTDKAVNPTNVMGASKRAAELYLQATQAEHRPMRAMAVRFGNVLGSSGSVVNTFRKQIERGGPVTVTHPEVVRYFMTVGEAVGLVLQCAALGEGGEIFVLDMGVPVKIADLARQMIELSGFRPGTDIEIAYTGLRPGEKLFEELRHTSETHAPTAHPRIYRFTAHDPAPADVRAWLRALAPVVDQLDPDAARARLRELLPEYVPAPNAGPPVTVPAPAAGDVPVPAEAPALRPSAAHA